MCRCRDCPRLAAYLECVRRDYPDYHAGPVAPFGDPAARLLIERTRAPHTVTQEEKEE